jgi:hypothetical protein
VALDQSMPEELGKDISSSPELDFERGDSGWRNQDEQNGIDTLEGGSD